MRLTNPCWLSPTLGIHLQGIIDVIIFCFSLSSSNMPGPDSEGLSIPDILGRLTSADGIVSPRLAFIMSLFQEEKQH